MKNSKRLIKDKKGLIIDEVSFISLDHSNSVSSTVCSELVMLQVSGQHWGSQDSVVAFVQHKHSTSHLLGPRNLLKSSCVLTACPWAQLI